MPTDSPTFTLPLSGSLTTPNSDETRAAVMEALGGHASVVLDCAGATETDLAFVQILIAASRSAAQAQKRIALKSPPEGVLAEALRRCGFAPPANATSLAEVLSL